MKENDFTLEKARSRWYPAQTIMDVDYADDIALLASTSGAGSRWHRPPYEHRQNGAHVL